MNIKYLRYRSLAFLVAANLIPLFGVLFFQWDVKGVILLYWLENIIIGFFNVIKIMLLDDDKSNHLYNIKSNLFISFIYKILRAFIFLVHYLPFLLVHGLFLIFLLKLIGSFEINSLSLKLLISTLIFPFIVLLLSHAFSFVDNYIFKKEYVKANYGALMIQPYRRIAIMHVLIIFGSFVLAIFKNSFYLVFLLICLKIGADIKGHLDERSKFKKQVEIKVQNDVSQFLKLIVNKNPVILIVVLITFLPVFVSIINLSNQLIQIIKKEYNKPLKIEKKINIKSDEKIYCQQNSDCGIRAKYDSDSQCCYICELEAISMIVANKEGKWYDENCKKQICPNPICDYGNLKPTVKCLSKKCQLMWEQNNN